MELHSTTSSPSFAASIHSHSGLRSGAARTAVVAILVPFVIFATPIRVAANEVTAGGSAAGFVIHGVQETLNQYCTPDSEGTLWFELPSGARFELVTSTADPLISNPGDGAFHPFEEAEVRAALSTLRFPLTGVRADIYLLPYPRRGGLESAAGPGLILLAPGVRPLPREIQHAQLVHELGHVVQYLLMPDRDAARWQTYRQMRGIENAATYSSSSMHANRPHEIFAEDFRSLFGGTLANYSGSIENPSLSAPDEVHGLDRFMIELTGSTAAEVSMRVWPVPARGAVHFASRDAAPAPLELFDAAGRRVARLQPQFAASGIEWSWNGLEDSGRRAPAGVLFARVRGDARRVTLVTVAP